MQYLFPMVVLGRRLFQEGIKFLYFWGRMTSDMQQRQVDKMKSDPQIKVMVSEYRYPTWYSAVVSCSFLLDHLDKERRRRPQS